MCYKYKYIMDSFQMENEEAKDEDCVWEDCNNNEKNGDKLADGVHEPANSTDGCKTINNLDVVSKNEAIKESCGSEMCENAGQFNRTENGKSVRSYSLADAETAATKVRIFKDASRLVNRSSDPGNETYESPRKVATSSDFQPGDEIESRRNSCSNAMDKLTVDIQKLAINQNLINKSAKQDAVSKDETNKGSHCQKKSLVLVGRGPMGGKGTGHRHEDYNRNAVTVQQFAYPGYGLTESSTKRGHDEASLPEYKFCKPAPTRGPNMQKFDNARMLNSNGVLPPEMRMKMANNKRILDNSPYGLGWQQRSVEIVGSDTVPDVDCNLDDLLDMLDESEVTAVSEADAIAQFEAKSDGPFEYNSHIRHWSDEDSCIDLMSVASSDSDLNSVMSIASPDSGMGSPGNLGSPESPSMKNNKSNLAAQSPRQYVSNSPQQMLNSPQQMLGSPQQMLGSPQQMMNSPQQMLSSPQQIVSELQQVDGVFVKRKTEALSHILMAMNGQQVSTNSDEKYLLKTDGKKDMWNDPGLDHFFYDHQDILQDVYSAIANDIIETGTNMSTYNNHANVALSTGNRVKPVQKSENLENFPVSEIDNIVQKSKLQTDLHSPYHKFNGFICEDYDDGLSTPNVLDFVDSITQPNAQQYIPPQNPPSWHPQRLLYQDLTYTDNIQFNHDSTLGNRPIMVQQSQVTPPVPESESRAPFIQPGLLNQPITAQVLANMGSIPSAQPIIIQGQPPYVLPQRSTNIAHPLVISTQIPQQPMVSSNNYAQPIISQTVPIIMNPAAPLISSMNPAQPIIHHIRQSQPIISPITQSQPVMNHTQSIITAMSPTAVPIITSPMGTQAASNQFIFLPVQMMATSGGKTDFTQNPKKKKVPTATLR